MYKMT